VSAQRQPDPATGEAIQWMVRLRSGRVSAEERQDFERWQASDARHAQAWARLTDTVDTPYATLRAVENRLPGQAREARDVLLRPSRRSALRGLVLAVPMGGALLLADRFAPLAAFTADLSTGTAERRVFTLDDGSTVTLNARSMVDVAFSDDVRQLRLREGEMVVQVARDPSRPLIVTTAQGTARALGTRFGVRQDADRMRVTVLEHSVEVQAAATGARATLAAGECAVVGATAIERLDAAQFDGGAWRRGQLVVSRRPLSEVVGELQRYRRGILRVAPEVAGLPVQGVFPLDDVDRALVALADTLPVRVSRFGPWLTTVSAR
jgi:transmembrane sensor